MMIKYKLKDVATDLGVTTKDVIEVLDKYVGGESKKQTAILTEDELNIVFDYFTQKNNVDNFNNYYDSATKKSAPAEEKEKQPKKTNSEKPVQQKAPQAQKSQTKNDNKQSKQPAKSTPKTTEKPATQTSEEGEIQFRKRERKVVDTRQIVVDVERYNEKYDRLASEKIKSENKTNNNK